MRCLLYQRGLVATRSQYCNRSLCPIAGPPCLGAKHYTMTEMKTIAIIEPAHVIFGSMEWPQSRDQDADQNGCIQQSEHMLLTNVSCRNVRGPVRHSRRATRLREKRVAVQARCLYQQSVQQRLSPEPVATPSRSRPG